MDNRAENLDAWRALGLTMRRLREASGESLRQLEAGSDWVRGTLSQVETGKAKPSRALVELYDSRFSGDGLVLSMFAEAHAIQAEVGRLGLLRRVSPEAGDDFAVVDCNCPPGTIVAGGAELAIAWKVHNRGTVTWRDRVLVRVGAAAGVRLLAGRAQVEVPDADPGATVSVTCPVFAPMAPGTVVAHWAMARRDGTHCFFADRLLAVTVVVIP